MSSKTEQPSTEVSSLPQAACPLLHVSVLTIPVVGASGKLQNRTVVFSDRPTKEAALKTLQGLHEEFTGRDDYVGEWLRCVDVVQAVPEELFSQMNQRRARKITHLVTLDVGGTKQSRLFSARSCRVHGWTREAAARFL